MILGFCRFLRANGFPVGTKQTVDSFRVAELVGIADRDAVRSAWRALFCTSQEETGRFDLLFDAYWNQHPLAIATPQDEQKLLLRSGPEGKLSHALACAEQASKLEQKATGGASAMERLKKMDFSKIPAHDLAQLQEIAMQLWKRMSMRMIRRRRMHGKQGPVDLRRTIRHSIGHGGDPVELMRKSRKRKKTNLVVLLDVSGSMELYSLFLLRFVYALNQYFKRVDSFLFSTRLTPVSPTLRKKDISKVFEKLSEDVEDWSGGTRIGECLQIFQQQHGRRVLNNRTVVMILSDGWDTGDPELLSNQLAQIHRRVHRLIWLNPLLGLAGYQPLTRGMVSAMPHADVFAPAHNLESLLDLERYWIHR